MYLPRRVACSPSLGWPAPIPDCQLSSRHALTWLASSQSEEPAFNRPAPHSAGQLPIRRASFQPTRPTASLLGRKACGLARSVFSSPRSWHAKSCPAMNLACKVLPPPLVKLVCKGSAHRAAGVLRFSPTVKLVCKDLLRRESGLQHVARL
eukprot:350848-Chlamydomonas_euryale.AAC.5